MKLAFEVDVPFEIPTLRFILERRYDAYAKGSLTLSCYMDKGRDLLALALKLKSLDDVGRCAQLLAQSAAWTVECLERWPRDEETGRLKDFKNSDAAWFDGKPLFVYTRDGAPASYDSEENWKATP